VFGLIVRPATRPPRSMFDPIPMSLRHTLLVMGLVSVSACASSAGGRGGPQCGLTLRESPEALSSVTDSLAIQGRVSVEWVIGTRLALARASYDSTGALRRAEVLSETMSREGRATMATALEGVLPASFEPDGVVYLFLGDDNGPSVRRLDRFRMCAPAILRASWLVEQLRSEARGLTIRRPTRVWVFALVQPDGSVSETRIDESSGNIDADLAAARIVRAASFRPAVLEGMRVEVWTRFPINFLPFRGPGR